MVKFEERLWSIIHNFVTLGREMPAMLVNAVRIVELQELVDAKLEASVHREAHCLYHCLTQYPGPVPFSQEYSKDTCRLTLKVISISFLGFH